VSDHNDISKMHDSESTHCVPDTLLGQQHEHLNRFHATFEQTAVGMAHVGLDGTWLRVNQKLCDILGYTRAEMRTHTFQDVAHTDHIETDKFDLQRLLAGELATYAVEKRYHRKDGATIWVNLTVSIATESGAEPGYFIVVIEDISRHKEAQEHLKRQFERLAALRAIDVVLLTRLDLNSTLRFILDQIIHSLGVDAAAVFVLSREDAAIELAIARGISVIDLKMPLTSHAHGPAGIVAAVGRLLASTDFAEPERDGLRQRLAVRGLAECYAVPLIVKGQTRGILEIYHRAQLTPGTEWLDYLTTLAGQAAIAIESAYLHEDLRRANSDLVLSYDATIEGWSRALDLRDHETVGHSDRVTALTLRLARQIEIDPEQFVHIRRGALLHDIGKMGVPDRILHKPGPLTEDEWVTMRMHPQYAYEMLYPVPFLRPALDIPLYHHEKWDGTGYPHGVQAEKIPLAARMFAVVDVWDALRSDRPYRAAWPRKRVREHIKGLSGSHFDPEILAAFLKLPRL
jgi:PAS domain S-box-containing protein/putative nucleotidyltransferase with HDIG domain